MGLEVDRAELVHAEDDFGLALLGHHLAVGDGIEMLDAGLLGRVIGVVRGLPALYALKGDAFLAEQDAQALVADVVDHPLGDQEFGQLDQAPGHRCPGTANRDSPHALPKPDAIPSTRRQPATARARIGGMTDVRGVGAWP
ncbi:hypothetical protein NRF20_43685 [Streptomyces sp. R-74717]